jgi:hypothetical protein
MYRIIAIEVDSIADLDPMRFTQYVQRHFAARREPTLVAVRNFERHNGDEDDWWNPADFSRRGRAAVNRIHTAYRRGFVQLRVKLKEGG